MDANHPGRVRGGIVHPLTQGFVGVLQHVLREGVHGGQIPGDAVPQKGLRYDLVPLPIPVGKVMPKSPMDLQVDEPRRDGAAVHVHDLLPLPGSGAKGQNLRDPVPFETQVPIDKVAVQQQLPVLNEHVSLPSRAHTIPFPRLRGTRKG